MYNKLLQRQLQKHLAIEEIPENFVKVLEVISDSYDHYEKERKMLERVVELSSNEMIELNSNLRKEKDLLNKAHKELNDLLEDINEVFFSLDMITCCITQMSAGCKKLYGYTSEEFFEDEKLWHRLIYPPDKEIRKSYLDKLRNGKQVVVQYRIVHKDKSILWIENKIMPVLNETGTLIRIDGVTGDITERKHAEEQLEKSFSLLEATLESTADGILVADLNGSMVRWNNRFLEMWKIPDEIMNTGKDEKGIAFVLNQLTNPEEFTSKIKELMESKEAMSFDMLTFKDGRIFERYSQPQVINGLCVGRVWSFRDVSASKKSELALIKSEASLELKNQELEQFVYVASHDLQEPLRTITGFIKLLQDKFMASPDEKTKKFFDFILEGAERMKILIQDLLDYSRIGKKDTKKTVDCNQLLINVIADLGAAINETGAIINYEALPVIEGYPVDMKQLFQNLIMNAIKFRKENIVPFINITVKQEKDHFQFCVKDNGIGIEKYQSERVFIIFQRLHNRTEYEGSGIGLANCKKIVELHGGKIWLTSEPGVGTAFFFTIF